MLTQGGLPRRLGTYHDDPVLSLRAQRSNPLILETAGGLPRRFAPRNDSIFVMAHSVQQARAVGGGGWIAAAPRDLP